MMKKRLKKILLLCSFERFFSGTKIASSCGLHIDYLDWKYKDPRYLCSEQLILIWVALSDEQMSS